MEETVIIHLRYITNPIKVWILFNLEILSLIYSWKYYVNIFPLKPTDKLNP